MIDLYFNETLNLFNNKLFQKIEKFKNSVISEKIIIRGITFIRMRPKSNTKKLKNKSSW